MYSVSLMPYNPDDLRYYPGHWDPRPELKVPPDALLNIEKTEEYYVFRFYRIFRWREKYDNFHNGDYPPPAQLKEIWECFIKEFERTVRGVQDGSITMTVRHFSRLKSPMPWGRFWHILCDFDEKYFDEPLLSYRNFNFDKKYFDGPPSPSRRIDRSHDIVKIGEQSYFFDNTPSNPIMSLKRPET